MVGVAAIVDDAAEGATLSGDIPRLRFQGIVFASSSEGLDRFAPVSRPDIVLSSDGMRRTIRFRDRSLLVMVRKTSCTLSEVGFVRSIAFRTILSPLVERPFGSDGMLDISWSIALSISIQSSSPALPEAIRDKLNGSSGLSSTPSSGLSSMGALRRRR